MAHVKSDPVSTGPFSCSVRSSTPFPTRPVAGAIRAMAAVLVEPVVRDFRAVVAGHDAGSHRQGDYQSPAHLSAAPDLLGVLEPGLESGAADRCAGDC